MWENVNTYSGPQYFYKTRKELVWLSLGKRPACFALVAESGDIIGKFWSIHQFSDLILGIFGIVELRFFLSHDSR